ncbi:MAG: GNAT family N-acetyltransferase [Nocardioides sp.]|nr:GNAT family N-acetyltransferase [Nocardioides sp.]
MDAVVGDLAGPPERGLVLSLRPVPLAHPDAQHLVARVQAEYMERYGGQDDSPIDLHEFDPPGGAFFVGYALTGPDGTGGTGEPAAMGGWRRTTVRALGGTDAAEVKRMYVVPEARGRGWSAQVLAHLELTAADAGVDELVLETGIRQPEAIGLYTSRGYVRVPGFGHYRDSPLSRCFARRLPGPGIS